MIDNLAREREAVVRGRKLDVRVLVWTMFVCYAVGGEARSIAAYRRTYNRYRPESRHLQLLRPILRTTGATPARPL